MAAATLMLRPGSGILRTQAAARRALVHPAAPARPRRWAWRGRPTMSVRGVRPRRLDPSRPAHAAVMDEAARTSARAASYTAFDGTPPADAGHFAVAAAVRARDRAAAPAAGPLRRRMLPRRLRRHAAAGLGSRRASRPARGDGRRRPAGRARSSAASSTSSRRCSSQDREGERFDAVVIDDGLVQLRDPAVRASRESCPPPGSEVCVRLERADPATRTVAFTVA